MHVREVVVLLNKPFFYVLVAVASLDLKVPIDVVDINCKN